jgi:hypothetical protein
MSASSEIYTRANQALFDGKYKTGIKLFKQVLEMQPDLNALNGLVECYMGMDDTETALSHARALREWAQKCGHKFMVSWAEAHIYTLENKEYKI